MTKKRGAKPVTIYCSVCNRPHPNKARPARNTVSVWLNDNNPQTDKGSNVNIDITSFTRNRTPDSGSGTSTKSS